jgi:hypothetical protein
VTTRKGAPEGTPLLNAATAKSQVPPEGTALLRHLPVLHAAASGLLASGDANSAERLAKIAAERPAHVQAIYEGEATRTGSPGARAWDRRREAARRLPALGPGSGLEAHDSWLDGVA